MHRRAQSAAAANDVWPWASCFADLQQHPFWCRQQLCPEDAADRTAATNGAPCGAPIRNRSRPAATRRTSQLAVLGEDCMPVSPRIAKAGHRSQVASALGCAPSGSSPLTKNPDHPISKLNCPHNRTLKDAGVSFVLYDLRHTFATRAAEAGVPLATLAAILDHNNLRSVIRYVHPSEADQFRAIDRLAPPRQFRIAPACREPLGFDCVQLRKRGMFGEFPRTSLKA